VSDRHIDVRWPSSISLSVPTGLDGMKQTLLEIGRQRLPIDQLADVSSVAGGAMRVLTVCLFRHDPALPAIFIEKASRPILRRPPTVRHPITKLITSSSIQAFP
jgi:hypothetical protein